MTGFFDSNILIDFLNGIPEAETTLAPFSRRCISRITWMEVMAGAKKSDIEDGFRVFLSQFETHELSAKIAESAVALRRYHVPRLALPDAIILASAREAGCRLTTRNTKDFPETSPDIHVPYRL